MIPRTIRALYTCGLHTNSARKHIKGKVNNIYRSVPDFLKLEENQEYKDITKSTFRKWVKKEIYGEYYDNTNAKNLRASTFPNIRKFSSL